MRWRISDDPSYDLCVRSDELGGRCDLRRGCWRVQPPLAVELRPRLQRLPRSSARASDDWSSGLRPQGAEGPGERTSEVVRVTHRPLDIKVSTCT